MDFLKIFLRGMTLLPSIIQGVEGGFKLHSGAQKKAAVVEIVDAVIMHYEGLHICF